MTLKFPGDPPAADEIECSVMGPGFGESIVVHLGLGDWMIVDSCVPLGTETPAALQYLSALSVPTTAVKLLTATHWHDDHVRGIARLAANFPSAPFVLPDALRAKEFLDLLAYEPELLIRRSGVSELRQVMDGRRGPSGSPQQLKWAIADRPLYTRSMTPTATVTSLSPTDEAVTRTKEEFGRLLPADRETLRAIPSPRQNETSVVLHIEVGDAVMLLGADLEEYPPVRGWSRILESTSRPPAQASLFKVPHHGSKTGQHIPTWTTLLLDRPIAVVTPFSQGRHHLPRPEERRWLLDRNDDCFITSTGRPRARRRAAGGYDRSVQRSIRESTRWFREAESPIGMVRCRRRPGESKWRIEFFGRAGHIRDVN